MTLAAGHTLGPYEILSPLGAGGMGEVYKARDTRLDRIVAIKVLPAQLSSDPQFRDRFDREARTISALDHPHICALYDIGEQDGTSFLVMQYLEGDTLLDRLTKGALPLDQALQYAIQIADALVAAHRAGIVHRDLKPGNVMLTKNGAKLLDFGLAKTSAPVVAGAALSMLPTTPPNLTAQGAILGTFQYMAPEQLEGQDADPRTDIFAFGAVVYEMLTGKKAFEGKSQASLIAAILEREPPATSTIQPFISPALDRIVKKCLTKNPDHRWQTARDLFDELSWVVASGSQPSIPISRVGSRGRLTKTLLVVTSCLLAVAVTALAFVATRHADTTNDIRFLVTTPDLPAAADNGLAVSPDGRSIAFVASTPTNDTALFVRQMGSTTPQLLAGTEGAGNPFWSPDSRFVAFSAGDVLKKVDATGGPSQMICEMPGRNRAGTWSRDGTIVFASNGILNRVSAEGGRPVPVVSLNASRQEAFLTSPDFLPDGRHFLYVAWSGLEASRAIYVGSLDSPATTRLIASSSKALYAHPGYLLFEREGVLFAQSFDPKTLFITGEPTRIADHVEHISSGPHSAFSVSPDGVLIYREDSSSVLQFVWVDRSGKKRDPVAEPGSYGPFDLSPDGKQIAISQKVGNNTDIWLIDVVRGVPTRLTSDPAIETDPVWSPDGRYVVFSSDRNGLFQIFEKAQLVAALGSGRTRASDWSKDGAYLAYSSFESSAELDEWRLHDRTPVPILRSRANNRQGRFSPDTRWLAYQSDESGQWQINVMSFPAADQKRQISTKRGTQPRWRGDGKELYYVAPDGHMMVVDMQLGATIEPGVPRTLFETRLPSDVLGLRTSFAVTADGERFLLAAPLAQRESPSF
jgi:serine/threonine protein kinase/Tol biopolymer transport system component